MIAKTPKFTCARHRGSVMIVALIFSLIVAIGIASYLTLAITTSKIAHRSFYLNAAHNLADAGLENALWCLNNTFAYPFPSNFTQGGFSSGGGGYQATFNFVLSGGATGQVKVFCQNPNAHPTPRALVEATVTFGSSGSTITKTVEVYLEQRSFSDKGMIARNGMSFNGNVTVDSWKSRPTPAQDIQYSTHPTVRRANAQVASPALIALQNADIYGYAAIGTDDDSGISVGANGRLAGTFPGSVGIDSNRITYDFTASFPDVKGVPTSGTMLGAVTGNTPLASGTYIASSVTLNGSETISIAAGQTVTLVITSGLTLGGTSQVTIAPTGKLLLYVGGDITVAGGAGFQNGTTSTPNNPDAFTLLGTRTAANVIAGMTMQSWSIKGGSYLSATIFAPNANVTVNGTGDTYGSIVGNRVDMVGSGNFHQDESLGENRITGLWKLSKWREITSPSERASLKNSGAELAF